VRGLRTAISRHQLDFPEGCPVSPPSHDDNALYASLPITTKARSSISNEWPPPPAHDPM